MQLKLDFRRPWLYCNWLSTFAQDMNAIVNLTSDFIELKFQELSDVSGFWEVSRWMGGGPPFQGVRVKCFRPVLGASALTHAEMDVWLNSPSLAFGFDKHPSLNCTQEVRGRRISLSSTASPRSKYGRPIWKWPPYRESMVMRRASPERFGSNVCCHVWHAW